MGDRRVPLPHNGVVTTTQPSPSSYTRVPLVSPNYSTPRNALTTFATTGTCTNLVSTLTTQTTAATIPTRRTRVGGYHKPTQSAQQQTYLQEHTQENEE